MTLCGSTEERRRLLAAVAVTVAAAVVLAFVLDEGEPWHPSLTWARAGAAVLFAGRALWCWTHWRRPGPTGSSHRPRGGARRATAGTRKRSQQ